ncbi:MAG: peptidyl-prolyl cis-trans isomerase, partial [Gammaproteobacteria bacterium]|nr:peptidyl-prolyl cis-trans isomerase [Gammaproteobacteria bacterium]
MRPRLLRILRDPLFIFCLLGAGCFLLFDALTEDREAIIVSEAVRDALIDDFTVIEGRPPDAQDEAVLIDRFVSEEILFREALSRGLHLGDPRLRLILIEKMRFLLADIPREPTEEELVSFYVEHLSRYTSEPRYSLRNVFFRALPDDPEAVLDDLRDGADINGDPGFWLGNEIRGYHASVLRNVLGPAALPVIEGTAVGDWSGPIQSP